MPLLKANGLPWVNVIRTGPRDRPPLIFLHPVGLDLTWWAAQIDAFADDYDVIALDMPGHGLSDPLESAPTFEVMSDIVEAVLTDLKSGAAHVVGMSVGGMIAQTFALRRPDLVKSLTLVATLCTFPDAVRDALRVRAGVARTQGMSRIAELSNERWFPPSFRARRPDVLDRTTTSLLSRDPAFHAYMWEMIAGLDLEHRIPAIASPTLVVVGSEDINAPIAAARKIADLIPGASLELMPGIGHFPPYESPVAFNALLRRFLLELPHE